MFCFVYKYLLCILVKFKFLKLKFNDKKHRNIDYILLGMHKYIHFFIYFTTGVAKPWPMMVFISKGMRPIMGKDVACEHANLNRKKKFKFTLDYLGLEMKSKKKISKKIYSKL